jgi:hypothetical protein
MQKIVIDKLWDYYSIIKSRFWYINELFVALEKNENAKIIELSAFKIPLPAYEIIASEDLLFEFRQRHNNTVGVENLIGNEVLISRKIYELERHFFELLENIESSEQINPSESLVQHLKNQCELFIEEINVINNLYISETKKEILLQDFQKKDETMQEREIKHLNNEQKLVWKGTPSQFGFIIDRLIKGGFLDKPTSSFAKDAAFFLRHFEIDCTEQTLAKELSENTNSLETNNRKKISIPDKDKLN